MLEFGPAALRFTMFAPTSLCSIILEIVIEIFVIDIAIEIGMEQTRLFQRTLFQYVDSLTIFAIEIVINFYQRDAS